jgi:hypothetical protein
VASALINSTQQIGGSVGTALLNTIATSVTATYLPAHGVLGSVAAATGAAAAGGATAATVTAGTVHGFAVAFAIAALVLGLAIIVVASFINAEPGAGGEVANLGDQAGDGEGGREGGREGSEGDGRAAPAYLPA